MVTLELEVISSLEVDPEPLARAKEPREPQGGIRADSTFAVDNLVNPTGWDPDRDREAMLSNAERLEEV